MPKISVVIPTYNRADYLNQAIKTVLAQRNADFEVVISDNDSQDHTSEVVNRYLADERVRYYKNDTNIGMVPNWRKAVYELASGGWFVLLSDDDYFVDPDYLSNVTEMLENNPSLTMVYAEGYLLDEDTGEKIFLALPFEGVVRGEEVFASRGTVKPQDFTLCNVVFNRQLAIDLESFSNDNNLSCDTELFLKLATLGNVGVIKGAASVYRFHSGNLIKSTIRSPELIYGSLDCLVSPYFFAASKMSDECLAKFRINSRLDYVISTSFLIIACHSWKLYRAYRHDFDSKFSTAFSDPINSMAFRMKLMLCVLFGWSFPLLLRPYRFVKSHLS